MSSGFDLFYFLPIIFRKNGTISNAMYMERRGKTHCSCFAKSSASLSSSQLSSHRCTVEPFDSPDVPCSVSSIDQSCHCSWILAIVFHFLVKHLSKTPCHAPSTGKSSNSSSSSRDWFCCCCCGCCVGSAWLVVFRVVVFDMVSGR